ncbi:MAG: YabP/YqfC family sporulation protein [Oscillospiraceae bacterium]
MTKKPSRNRCNDGSKFLPSPAEKKTLFEAFKEPIKNLFFEPQMQLIGNSELFIEGCQSILEYDDMMITLLVGKRKLLIMGRELTVSGYTDSSITVKGFFQGLEWS